MQPVSLRASECLPVGNPSAFSHGQGCSPALLPTGTKPLPAFSPPSQFVQMTVGNVCLPASPEMLLPSVTATSRGCQWNQPGMCGLPLLASEGRREFTFTRLFVLSQGPFSFQRPQVWILWGAMHFRAPPCPPKGKGV